MTEETTSNKSRRSRNLEIDDSLLPGANRRKVEVDKSRDTAVLDVIRPFRNDPQEQKESPKDTPRQQLGPQERPTIQMERFEGAQSEKSDEISHDGDRWFKYASAFALGFLVATVIALSTAPPTANVPIVSRAVSPEPVEAVAPSKTASAQEGEMSPAGKSEKSVASESKKAAPKPAAESVVETPTHNKDLAVDKKVEESSNTEKEGKGVKKAVKIEKKETPRTAKIEKKAAAKKAAKKKAAARKAAARKAAAQKAAAQKAAAQKAERPQRVIGPFTVMARVPLKIRQGPSQHTPRVGGVAAGTQMQAVGRKPGTAFIKIRSGKKSGWVAHIRGFVIVPKGHRIGDLPALKE